MKKTLTVAGAAVALLLGGAPVALAQDPDALSHSLEVGEGEDCGTAVLTLVNNSALGDYTFDYRVDDEPGVADDYSNIVIKEGPLADEKFGLLHNPVTVPKGQIKRIDLTFEEDQGGGSVTLQVGARRGPEQRELLPYTAVVIDTNCTDEEPEPTPEPKTPGNVYNCDDFATRAQAQAKYDEDSSDPHNLDFDGNGQACERAFDPNIGVQDEDDVQDDNSGDVVTPSGGVATGGGPA